VPFWPFRRKETLNERLMRDAGLGPPPVELGTPTEEGRAELEESWFDDRSLTFFERLSGEVTAPRPRRWDAVVSAAAPGVAGLEVAFVALPDGSLVVDEEQGEGDLTPLAEAVEGQIPAPYRAHGVRRGSDLWAVGVKKIQTASFAAEGEEIELTEHNGFRTLSVDGSPTFGRIPELERIGETEGDSYVVRARRLEGDTWEIRVDRL
jgi:hypothetical protein